MGNCATYCYYAIINLRGKMAVKSLTVIRAFYSKLIFMCCLVLERIFQNGNSRKVILLHAKVK